MFTIAMLGNDGSLFLRIMNFPSEARRADGRYSIIAVLRGSDGLATKSVSAWSDEENVLNPCTVISMLVRK